MVLPTLFSSSADLQFSGCSHFICASFLTCIAVIITPFIAPPLTPVELVFPPPLPSVLQSTCDTLRSHSDSLGFTPNMLPRHPTLGNFEEFACWRHNAGYVGGVAHAGDLTANSNSECLTQKHIVEFMNAWIEYYHQKKMRPLPRQNSGLTAMSRHQCLFIHVSFCAFVFCVVSWDYTISQDKRVHKGFLTYVLFCCISVKIKTRVHVDWYV